MPRGPSLLRRRSVWVPTPWGLALLLLLVVAAALVFARYIGVHLSRSEPARGADGRGAQTLVVEGWLPAGGLDAAVAAFRAGRYERVVVSGGPFEDWPEDKRFATYAERATDYLKRHGLADATVTAAPAPSTANDRTFVSAVVVRDWAAKSGTRLGAIDLFSSGVHAHRSRLVFRMAFGPSVEIGVLAAPPVDHDPARWWTTSAGAKAVLGETLSVAWTHCCFWPDQPGSLREQKAAPPPGA